MKACQYFLVNAFTGVNSLGNQACVLFVDDLSDDSKLQAIAANMNLPATTFLMPFEDGYKVRWFAPMAEIGLCGHGTIAATWVLSRHLNKADNHRFYFNTGAIDGYLTENGVAIKSDAIPYNQQPIPDHVISGFNDQVEAYYSSGNKDIVVFPSDELVKNLSPNWDVLKTSPIFGYVITAPGFDTVDCVSRVILPHISILEDQATGSAHFLVAPYWAERLNKPTIEAYQASERGGVMTCRVENNQVELEAVCTVFGLGQYLL